MKYRNALQSYAVTPMIPVQMVDGAVAALLCDVWQPWHKEANGIVRPPARSRRANRPRRSGMRGSCETGRLESVPPQGTVSSGAGSVENWSVEQRGKLLHDIARDDEKNITDLK